MNMERLMTDLERHEGLRTRMYKCTAGANTIGIGHNLDSRPISERAAKVILEDDIEVAIEDIERGVSMEEFYKLPGKVQEALVNMCFNMGITRLLQFKNTLRLLKEERWADAAIECLDSRWANQVGGRAKEISDMIASGDD